MAPFPSLPTVLDSSHFAAMATSPSRADGGSDLRRLSISLPCQIHKELKLFAIQNGLPISEVMRRLAEDFIADEASG